MDRNVPFTIGKDTLNYYDAVELHARNWVEISYAPSSNEVTYLHE